MASPFITEADGTPERHHDHAAISVVETRFSRFRTTVHGPAVAAALLSSQMRIEAMNTLLSRISIDPNVCFGKACIRGTRIWVSLILDLLASGETQERILEEYPQLSREDILSAIAYGAEMSRARFVDLPGQSAA